LGSGDSFASRYKSRGSLGNGSSLGSRGWDSRYSYWNISSLCSYSSFSSLMGSKSFLSGSINGGRIVVRGIGSNRRGRNIRYRGSMSICRGSMSICRGNIQSSINAIIVGIVDMASVRCISSITIRIAISIAIEYLGVSLGSGC